MFGWQRREKQNAQSDELRRLEQMLDQMPINIMVCEVGTWAIRYANKTSTETLTKLQSLMPVPVEHLIGKSIDIFHKNPAHQRQLLSDPQNLPHHAKVKWGTEVLDLKASPIFDREGNYTSVLMTWGVATKMARMTDAFESNVKAIVEVVSSASTELQATAEGLSTAAGQLGEAINEISKQVSESSHVATDGAQQATKANVMTSELAKTSRDIGDIVDVIKGVASKTNMLALNATIEAARAGEQGKGFAVVAGEVKLLAGQTAQATENITRQITAMQEDATKAATGMDILNQMMEKINTVTSSIASAIEEQSASTQETGRSAGDVLVAARELSKQSETLRLEVDNFLGEMRKN